MTLQEKHDCLVLQAELLAQRIDALEYQNTTQANKITALEEQLATAEAETKKWRDHVVCFERVPPSPMYASDQIAHQIIISAGLFFSLSASVRQQLWLDEVRRATVELFRTLSPHC